MIANLKIMAKMFAKIAKMFDVLSTTIIATRRRLALILYLEAKYAKMDYKNEIYMKKRQRWRQQWPVAREARDSITPELWSACEGAWRVQWGQFFSSDVDRRKTIPTMAAVSWSEQYWWHVRWVEKLPNLWPTRGGTWMVRWWWFWRPCVDRLKNYSVICLMS